MSDARYYMAIKDKKIPVIVRNYTNTNVLKIYFRGEILNISKPRNYTIDKVIKEYGDAIYKQYIEVLSPNHSYIRHWKNGESLLYKGETFSIHIIDTQTKRVSIDLDEKQKICFIGVAKEFKEEERRQKIHIAVKKWFQKRTEEILSTRLEEWSRFMNIPYQSYRVNDTISKYGSCMPKKQKLFFTLRLAMLPEKIIDSIIVHELCHMIHPDHSKDFYALVKKYIEDYDECDKWLKNNSQYINL